MFDPTRKRRWIEELEVEFRCFELGCRFETFLRFVFEFEVLDQVECEGEMGGMADRISRIYRWKSLAI